LELIQENGLEGLSEMIRLMVNQAMLFERENFLNARAYERSEDRTGYANGYKPKTVNTRVGKVTFAIPQVREGNFYPHALEKGLRSERALMLALAEMYACTGPQVHVFKVSAPEKWQPSQSSYAEQALVPHRLAGQPRCLMRSLSPGATVH
jgi:transposase-like protein